MICSDFRAQYYAINTLRVFVILAFSVLNVSTVVAVEKETSQPIVETTQKTIGSSSNLPAAVLWYQEKASHGDAEAQYNLGNVYEVGFGVEVNFELAAKWYKDAAEQEHELAQLKLGILYILGKGVRESTLKGGKWIRAAARQGNSVAQTLQDRVLSHNVQQDFDVKALVNSVRQGLEKGETNAEETIKLALLKIERIGKDAPKDSRFVKGVTGSGAKKGSVGNRIPSFLDKESQTNTEIGTSISIVRRYAKEGIAEAQYKLARYYETGEKVERSRSEAFKWYIAAANQNHAPSQYRLGMAFLYGFGVEQNIETARAWLKKAKLANDPNATLFLQHMSLAKGKGVDKSIALSWYLERSLTGDGEAMLALGNMYESGWGVNQNSNEAKKWYIKARVAGTKGAAIQLRRMKVETAVDEEPIEGQASLDAIDEPLATDSISTDNSLHENLGANASTNSVFEKLFNSARNAWDAMAQEAKENATPLMLAFLGIIMGVLVFRWMRKEETDETSIF